MKRIKLQELNVTSAFYILLLAGFIVISGLPYLFSVGSRVVTIPFRAFVLGVALFFIGKKLVDRKNLNLDFGTIIYIIFWITYLINVYLSFHNYQFTEDFKSKEYEIYLRIIGVCFLPSLAILFLDKKSINYPLIFNIVHFLIFIVLLLNVIVGIEYDYHGRSSGFLSTYSINFGHVGVVLAIMSFYQLVFKTVKFNYYTSYMLTGFFLGTYIMYASATRGPLVAYILVILVALFAGKKRYYLAVFSILFFLSIAGIMYFNSQATVAGENAFVNRVSNMMISGDSSGRGKLYSDAVSIFLDNPIFGGRFLFPNGVYAHNIFLDILMSMGIFGMVIFFLFFKKCVSEVLSLFQKKNVFEKEYIWLHLLYIQYLVFAFFSCSMFDTPEFWYLTAMMLVLSKNKEVSL